MSDPGYDSFDNIESETTSLTSQTYPYRYKNGRSDIEMQRLNVIHWAMCELWQANIRVPIPYPSAKIIDIGCGSGIWSKQVAEALPRSQVTGVDLSPTFLPEEPGRPHPENLRFEVDDVNFGLQYPDASFDIVTSRFIAGGINDWFATIREMFRILTGTGNSWIQLTELRPDLRCDDDSIPPGATSATWPRIFFSAGTIGNSLGTARFDEIATMLKARVTAAGFVDVNLYIDKAPVGSWHPDPRLNRIGRGMAQGWLGFLEAMKHILEPLYGGAAEVDNMIARVRSDYLNPNYHGYNLMYRIRKESLTNSYCVTGRKPARM